VGLVDDEIAIAARQLALDSVGNVAESCHVAVHVVNALDRDKYVPRAGAEQVPVSVLEK
jgi:hypothetical protein